MTSDQPVRSYLQQCLDRQAALQVLLIQVLEASAE